MAVTKSHLATFPDMSPRKRLPVHKQENSHPEASANVCPSSHLDFLAEMDYISKNYTISVLVKYLTPEEDPAATPRDFIPSVSHSIPKRVPTTCLNLDHPAVAGSSCEVRMATTSGMEKKTGGPSIQIKPKTKTIMELPQAPKIS
jgi:hypothetical protein